MTGAAGTTGTAHAPDHEREGPRAFAAECSRRREVRARPDFDRLSRLLDLLGQPQRALPSIVVTGSVGKSSTVSAIRGRNEVTNT
ncbi:hypothetical protein [Frankia sp. CcWB2]